MITLWTAPDDEYDIFYGAITQHMPLQGRLDKKPIACQRYVGRGGALVETMTFNRRVVGSTPAVAAT